VVFRTASASAVRRTSAFGSRVRSASHGGLTPPAPGCMRDTSRAICASDSQGRMCLGRECEPYANYAYSTCKFDRNIAAFMNAPSTRAYSICRLDTFTTAGLRQPLLVGNACATGIIRIPAASSTGTSLRPGTRPAHMRIYLRTRYVHHGCRTPSAPGCVCGRCCKCAILADEKDAFPRGAYAPPLLVARRLFGVKSDIRDAQTHVHKSGGRQPAVGRETRLRRYECDCSENRRQYVGRSPLPSRAAIPRGAYAPRSCR
jgi:hypothetical protein